MAAILVCDRCGKTSNETEIRTGRVHFKNHTTGRHDIGRTAGDFCEPCIDEVWPSRHKGNKTRRLKAAS